MVRGVRFRLSDQSFCVLSRDWDVSHWIQTGKVREQSQKPRRVEEDPAVMIARDQIRKDGDQVIPENIERAVNEWRASQGDIDNGRRN